MIEAKEVLAGDISVKESLAGEINNGVKVVSPSLIDLEVTPSKEKKTYKHEGSYGYDNVVVNAIPDTYITPKGTLDITSNGIYNVREYENVNTDVHTIPSLEGKVITPTKEVQTVVASEGYDGLSGVTVNAIPDEYVVPSGELEITENGTYDVKEYASTNINVPTGGALPEKGFVVNSFDSDGYATKVTVVGMTTLPTYMFAGYVSGSAYYMSVLTRRLEEIVLPESVTAIPNYCCYKCLELTKINLPDNITSIGSNAFYGSTKLSISKLPTNLKTLGASAFNGCTGLTQISMSNVTKINGSTSSNGSFNGCSNLKAVWIGSAINASSSSDFGRYAFYGTNLEKLYIDKPRAEVEAHQYYANAFTGGQKSTDIIICNDDADFITKEEFDATTF